MRVCAAVAAVHDPLSLLKATSKHNGLYGQKEPCLSFRQSFVVLAIECEEHVLFVRGLLMPVERSETVWKWLAFQSFCQCNHVPCGSTAWFVGPSRNTLVRLLVMF